MTVIFNGAGANANLGRIFETDLDSVLFTVAWASLAAMFSFSIAMVVWGRNGDGTLKF
jgi:cytochrome b6-f complex subunit 8|tara:strand:- start:100 stop:273 length:174 start_codon:yes stop_codon:yes gene_type:complete